MPKPPKAKVQNLSVACNDSEFCGVDFKLSQEIVSEISTKLTSVPDWLDFLKVAADYYAKLLDKVRVPKKRLKKSFTWWK
jgi:hypothetical protein